MKSAPESASLGTNERSPPAVLFSSIAKNPELPTIFVTSMNMRTPPSLLDENDADAVQVVQNEDVDFSEYMWMEQMEEFDQQVEEELRELDMIEQGFEDLFEMERIATEIISSSVENTFVAFDSSNSNGRTNGFVHTRQESLAPTITTDEVIVSSRLNPLAPEFVPRKQC